jgi:hypothetical protein
MKLIFDSKTFFMEKVALFCAPTSESDERLKAKNVGVRNIIMDTFVKE